ncbi:MAG: hypothetical protein JNM22_10235 [Saprospiraceae bacterium]|nr:hypothetical protein [Saprospiraceae bacterium]
MKNYQLTDKEFEEMSKWYDPEEIANAEHEVYTYEDWLDINRSIGPFIYGEPGIQGHYLTKERVSTTKGNGHLTFLILPESESQKIEQRKTEILQGWLSEYVASLVGWFESQYRKSIEKKILVEDELRQVNKLLFEYKENFSYSSYGDRLWLKFHTYANRKNGSMCDWYDKVCVHGDDPKRGISGRHSDLPAARLSTNDDRLHCMVAALAFHQFKKYLNMKLEEFEFVKDKILTEKDVFIYEPQLMGMPPSELELAQHDALQQTIVTERQAGKIPVLVNSHQWENILQGALKIGLTERELNVFIEKFGSQEYNYYVRGPHFDPEKDQLNITQLLDEIFSIASGFGNPALGNYFSQSAYNEVQRRATEHLPSQSLILQKRFNERFNEQEDEAITHLKAKPGRKPNPPRTFQSLFKGEPEMNQLLDAAVSIGLIVKDGDGYTWPDEGNKSHRIRAFWYTAIDAGLTGKNLKNKETIAKAIKEFFRMESLSKDTIENENPHHEVYQRTKAALEKRMKVQ